VRHDVSDTDTTWRRNKKKYFDHGHGHHVGADIEAQDVSSPHEHLSADIGAQCSVQTQTVFVRHDVSDTDIRHGHRDVGADIRAQEVSSGLVDVSADIGAQRSVQTQTVLQPHPPHGPPPSWVMQSEAAPLAPPSWWNKPSNPRVQTQEWVVVKIEDEESHANEFSSESAREPCLSGSGRSRSRSRSRKIFGWDGVEATEYRNVALS
jgi:hypothetical protein